MGCPGRTGVTSGLQTSKAQMVSPSICTGQTGKYLLRMLQDLSPNRHDAESLTQLQHQAGVECMLLQVCECWARYQHLG